MDGDGDQKWTSSLFCRKVIDAKVGHWIVFLVGAFLLFFLLELMVGMLHSEQIFPIPKQGLNLHLMMGIVTWATLDDRILCGRGQGHHDLYKPWLWIHRKNVSSMGNQVVDPLPGYRRGSHFMAQVEWHVAMLCLYLGALDVREQFPLWPFPHVHPLADYTVTGKSLPTCDGLISIARAAGIHHGSEVGSDAPYVASLDLAVTIKSATGVALAGIALKPHELILTAEPTDRIVERLELERLCMHTYQSSHKVVDRALLGHSTGGNLEFLSSGARLPIWLQRPSLIQDFRNRFVSVALETSINIGIHRAGAELDLSPVDANLLWRHLAWHRMVEIDVTQPIQIGRPLVIAGRSIADAISKELFGEVLL